MAGRMVYHERQSHSDSCRMHALHSIFGRPVFGTWADFQANICDTFDKRHGFPVGMSRSVTAPGFMEHAVQAVDRSVHATCFQAHDRDKKHAVVQVLSSPSGPMTFTALGLLAFNGEHVWAAVRAGSGSGWTTVDSLSPFPTPCSLPALLKESIGFYLVTKDKSPPGATTTTHVHVPTSQHLSVLGHHRHHDPDAVRVLRVLHSPPLPRCGRVGVRSVDQKGTVVTRLA